MASGQDARFAEEQYLRHIMLDYMQMTEFVKDPFIVAKADGIRFWDVHGKEYLDGLAGIFVVNVGYNNPPGARSGPAATRDAPVQPPDAWHQPPSHRTGQPAGLAACTRGLALRPTSRKQAAIAARCCNSLEPALLAPAGSAAPFA